MNFDDLAEGMRDRRTAALDRFKEGGEKSPATVARLRATAEAALKAEQDESHEAAVAAKILALAAAGDEGEDKDSDTSSA